MYRHAYIDRVMQLSTDIIKETQLTQTISPTLTMIQHHTKLTISTFQGHFTIHKYFMYIKELHVPIDKFHQVVGGIETTKKTTK